MLVSVQYCSVEFQFIDELVTGFRVHGFPKIKIERKPQKIFQTHFIKFYSSTKERKAPWTGRKLVGLAAFIIWG